MLFSQIYFLCILGLQKKNCLPKDTEPNENDWSDMEETCIETESI